MPTWSSMADYAASLAKLETELRTKIARDTIAEMAGKAEDIANKYAQRDVGSDREMRGWPTAPLTVRVRLERSSSGHRAVIMPYNRAAAAGWTVMDQGRNVGETGLFLGPGMNHRTGATSRTKKGNVRRRGFKAKKWNGVTRPHFTAADAVDEMERELPKIANRRVGKALVKQFDVS